MGQFRQGFGLGEFFARHNDGNQRFAFNAANANSFGLAVDKLNGHGFEVDHRDSFSSVSKKIIQFCRGPLFMGMATLAPAVMGAFVESSDCIGLCGMCCAWCAFVLIKRFNEVKKVQGS